MATLTTGQTELRQVERSRALADALQKMSVGFEPIAHPAQGWAKLAQAWAAASINNQARRREEEIAEQQRQAFAQALGPQYAYSSEITGMGGKDDLGQDVPSVFNQVQTAPGLPQQQIDMLMALDPQTRGAVLGGFLEQQMKAQAGITPQQLTPRNPTDPYDAVGPRVVTIPGQEPFEAEILRNMQGQLGYTDESNQFVPVSGDWLSEPISKTQEVPAASRMELSEQFAAGMSTLGELNRLEELVGLDGQSEESLAGSVFQIAEAFRSNINVLWGRTQVLVRGKVAEDVGQLSGTELGVYQNYTLENATDRDRQKYSQATMEANMTAWQQLQRLDAATQQLSISIAYSLARIADPGGRLSEMDVLNQIRSLGLQNPSKDRRLAAINEAKITFADQMYNRYSMYRANDINVELPPEFMNDLQRIRSGVRQTPSNEPPKAWIPYLENYAAEIERMRKAAEGMSPAEVRAFEREKGLPVGILGNGG